MTLRIKQSENDAPCGAGRSRWRVRPGCACAAGNHEPAPGAGCSAGRSACPWPRLSLLVASGGRVRVVMPAGIPGRTRPPLVSLVSLVTGAVPEDPVAAVSPTFGRLFEGTDVTCAGQTAPSGARTGCTIYWCHTRHANVGGPEIPAIPMLQNGWHPRGKLLASARAVSQRDGRGSARQQHQRSSPSGEPRQHRLTTDQLDYPPVRHRPPICSDEDDRPVHTCG